MPDNNFPLCGGRQLFKVEIMFIYGGIMTMYHPDGTTTDIIGESLGGKATGNVCFIPD